MRHPAPVSSAKHIAFGDLGGAVELLPVSSEAAQDFDSSRPSDGALPFGGSCPLPGQCRREAVWKFGMIGKRSKVLQCAFFVNEREAKAAPITQVIFDSCGPRNQSIHDGSPGHGSATARKPSRSTRV